MKKLELAQGSAEWLNSRKQCFCSSEAPAMMGDSKFQSRRQLLAEKSGVERKPVDAATQRRFDEGHKSEGLARAHLEVETLDDYLPVVGVLNVDGLKLLASFDGLNSSGVPWEHKAWNKTLAENVRNQVLEPHYYWQLEHQLLVCGGDEALFMCSDGTRENRVSMTYFSVPERRARLLEGWRLFAADLKGFEVEPVVEVVESSCSDSMPVLSAQVSGSAVSSNIGECIKFVRLLAAKQLVTMPDSDQDFADKEQLAKNLKASRAALKKSVAEVRDNFEAFAAFESDAIRLDAILQKLQSHSEKCVKDGKAAKKQAVFDAAQKSLAEFIDDCDARIKPHSIVAIVGGVHADWSTAAKGKRSIESIKSAVDEVLTKLRIDITAVVSVVDQNMALIATPDVDKFSFLFRDGNAILSMNPESFQAVVKQRIINHENEMAEKAKKEELEVQKFNQDLAPAQENEEASIVEADGAHCNLPFGLLESICAWSKEHNVNIDAVADLEEILKKHFWEG